MREVQGLPPPKQLNLNDPKSLFTGGSVDPYILFAMNEEELEKAPKEGAIGLGRATDLARTSTRWSSEQPRGTPRGSAEWPDGGESLFLYVKEPEVAQLAFTVFDEDVLKEDEQIGAASIKISDKVKVKGYAKEREWTGWIPLTWRPPETQDNAVMAGAVAGAFIAGPAGAAAGGVLANTFLKKQVQGSVKVTLRYTPLERPVAAAKKPPESPLEAAAHAAAIATAETPRSNGKAAKIDDGSPANSNQGTSPGSPERAHLLRLELTKLRERLARDAEEDKAAAAASESDKRSQKDAMSWSTSSKDGKESIEEEIAESSEPHTIPEMVSEAVPVPNGTKVQEWVAPRMAPRGLPRGASEGVDWSDLSKRVGNLGVVEGDAFELCCYVDHRPSSTQVSSISSIYGKWWWSHDGPSSW